MNNAGFFVSPSLGRTLSSEAVVFHPHLAFMKALGLAQCWVGLGYSGDQDRPCPSLWSSRAGGGDTHMIVQETEHGRRKCCEGTGGLSSGAL